MFPLPFSTPISEFESRLKIAESKLLEIAKRDNTRPADSWELKSLDTFIPRSAVPCLKPAKTEEDKTLKIHCIRVASNDLPKNETTEIPLVNLHGYMNAGAYFYRNFCGLSKYFRTIYAVDMLGWGLSSRVPFDEVKESGTITSAEDFFVESLEAFRSENNIDKMILSGHSFGAYVAVAYCERYPDRVERLILLSPFGVPDPQDPNILSKWERIRSSLRGLLFIWIFQRMFDWTTPGAVIRSFTEHRGMILARSYIERRLPMITNVEESETLADFLYINAALPASGEYFLRSLFTNSMLAKKPLLFRVPRLKVKSVNFMYGTTDWMDLSGGLYTGALCHRLSQQKGGQSSPSLSISSIPDVNVFLVPNAGHLLILQNPKLVNACMIGIAGGEVRDVRDEEMPTLMDVDEKQELPESWLSRVQDLSKEQLNGRKVVVS